MVSISASLLIDDGLKQAQVTSNFSTFCRWEFDIIGKSPLARSHKKSAKTKNNNHGIGFTLRSDSLLPSKLEARLLPPAVVEKHIYHAAMGDFSPASPLLRYSSETEASRDGATSASLTALAFLLPNRASACAIRDRGRFICALSRRGYNF